MPKYQRLVIYQYIPLSVPKTVVITLPASGWVQNFLGGDGGGGGEPGGFHCVDSFF